MSFPLSGLIAAAYTPMFENGEVDLTPIKDFADLFVEADLSGVFVCGTTGECHSLSTDERRAITDAWCDAAGDRLTLVAHIGSNCQNDAISLARHAAQAGVHGISAMAPFFFKPANVEQLIDYVAPIAAAGGDLPFYFYHIPPLTNVNPPMSDFLRKAGERIPNLAGIKFSSGEFMALQQCLTASDGRFDVLFGQDENLLAGLAVGVRGAIGSTYNYAAPLYQRVIEAFQSGDMLTAQREQAKSVEMIEALRPFGVLESGKAIMKMIGIDCGPVRAPLTAIDAETANRIHQRIRHLDVFSRPLEVVNALA